MTPAISDTPIFVTQTCATQSSPSHKVQGAGRAAILERLGWMEQICATPLIGLKRYGRRASIQRKLGRFPSKSEHSPTRQRGMGQGWAAFKS